MHSWGNSLWLYIQAQPCIQICYIQQINTQIIDCGIRGRSSHWPNIYVFISCLMKVLMKDCAWIFDHSRFFNIVSRTRGDRSINNLPPYRLRLCPATGLLVFLNARSKIISWVFMKSWSYRARVDDFLFDLKRRSLACWLCPATVEMRRVKPVSSLPQESPGFTVMRRCKSQDVWRVIIPVVFKYLIRR